jgi:dephospho-CoA kinase
MLAALTGGIASGKSTVARRLADLGAHVVDADVVAREVVEPGTAALAAIAEEFGGGVLTSEGALDRAALGAIVFADPERRRRLEAITHPAVKERSRALFAAADGPGEVVVYDVPLLAESRGADGFEAVVVVEAPASVRLRRLEELRGMPRAEAERRIAAQATDEERRALADHVIDSSGSLKHTLEQTDALFAALSARA